MGVMIIWIIWNITCNGSHKCMLIHANNTKQNISHANTYIDPTLWFCYSGPAGWVSKHVLELGGNLGALLGSITNKMQLVKVNECRCNLTLVIYEV